MADTLNMFEVINHHFIGGVYCKSMRIPENHEVVSHAHHYDHMSVLTKGCVIVEADGVQETYWSPAVIEIKAGVHHSVTPVNGDAHWLCIHRTDCTDVEQVDDVLIKKRLHMHKLPFTVPVAELAHQLEMNPQLWNEHKLRTRTYEGSPHREVDDIWVRYRDPKEFDPENPQKFADKHESVWYDAYYKLPAIEWIVAQLVNHLGHFELGGVLITRIPPGKRVYPHSDAGSWHAEYYEDKVLVLVKSAPGQVFKFEGEEHEGEPGEVFVFDNHPVHEVINNSDEERISLIFAIKRTV